MRKRRDRAKSLWVVKAGSQMVCDGGPLLMRDWMSQVAALRSRGIDVIWVTSGAIGWAVRKANFRSKKKTLPQKQALSAIGQPLVMEIYSLALAKAELTGAQVLLTAGDMADRTRRANLMNTMNQLLRWGIVPILNENDAVATTEIKFGDNDALSSQIACMMKAERLVLLTDVDGLYDDDPKKNPNASLISYVKKVQAKHFSLVDKKATSATGTGGMLSKIMAAKTASGKGITTHLVRGDIPQNLLRIAAGEKLGTQIGGSL